MQRSCLTLVIRSVRVVAISMAGVFCFTVSLNATLFGTWTPAGDLGGPDSPWVSYTLGLTADDGSNIAALDFTLRGTFHQQWSSLVEGDPFEPTPSGAARNFDSHLTPIPSALILKLHEDSNPNSNDPATPLLPNSSRRQSGIGTTLGGVWGIPGADQTPSLDFAYIVVPRNADLSQIQFDIDVSTHNSGVFNTYGLHGCSLFSAGCSFNLTSAFDSTAPTTPPSQNLPPVEQLPALPDSTIGEPVLPNIPPAPEPQPDQPPLMPEPWLLDPTNYEPPIHDVTDGFIFRPYHPLQWGEIYIDATDHVADYDQYLALRQTLAFGPGYAVEDDSRTVVAYDWPVSNYQILKTALLSGSSANAGIAMFNFASTVNSVGDPAAAPEPTGIALVILALGGLYTVHRRRN